MPSLDYATAPQETARFQLINLTARNYNTDRNASGGQSSHTVLDVSLSFLLHFKTKERFIKG